MKVAQMMIKIVVPTATATVIKSLFLVLMLFSTHCIFSPSYLCTYELRRLMVLDV